VDNIGAHGFHQPSKTKRRGEQSARGDLAALYGLALFWLPIFFGAACGVHGEEGAREAYNRVAKWMLALVAISALYGIYQYAAPPPWYAYWAQQADIEGSQGAATAFNFRIFGTLNSTGHFAGALTFALLLNLPRLSARRWYVGAAFVPIAVALALTSVRACWLSLLAGTVCFLLLAPRRQQAAFSLVAIGVLVVGVAFAAASTIRESSIALTSLTDRFTSFSDLQNDKSAAARGEQSAAVLTDALDEPLGLGLGSAGTALRLRGSNVVSMDNGYLARLSEMGLFGFALYIAALLAALAYALRAYALARQRRDPAALDLIAVAISLQVAFLTLETFTDSHYAFPGFFFWMVVCVASQHGGATIASPSLLPRFAEGRQTSGRAG
jgi:O-antigen ligase